jgi:hypothetical protein
MPPALTPTWHENYIQITAATKKFCGLEKQLAAKLYVKIFTVNTFFRSLLVWLMLIAVPFQGSASTQLPCAPVTSGTTASIEPAGHDHVSMISAHSGHNEHSTTVDAGQSDDGVPADHHASGKCGTLTACCIGASMAPPFCSAMPIQGMPSDPIPFDIGSGPTVDLPLPERPPQSSLV